MLYIVYLNVAFQVAGARLVYGRGGAAVTVPTAQIVKDTVELGCDGILLAHNHPSGLARPSRTDLAATRRIAQMLMPLGIRLHDHLIFGGAACFSFRAAGLL